MRWSSTLHCIAFTLVAYGALWRAQAQPQYIPSIPCPNFFQYLSYGNEYIGRITLPNVGQGTTRLDVQLTQRVPVLSNYYGRLSLFQDQQTTLSNINSGQPVSYRVDFPIPNVLPKLLRILLNGAVICSSADSSLGTVLNLQHMLQTTVQPFNSNSPQGTSPSPTIFIDPNTPFPFPQQPPATPPPPPPSISDPRINSVPQNFGAQCGTWSVEKTVEARPFIYKGDVITRGEYPWLTAIYRKQASSLKFLCGGSLVSPRSIVTAAHCFRVKTLVASQVAVYLGRYNLENYGENGVVPRDIDNLIVHPDYDPKTFPDADVAILQMTTPVSYTQYIRPICLWSEAVDASFIVGQLGFVAGWGSDENNHDVTDLPKVVSGAIVGDGDCARSSAVYTHLTSPRTICAGNRDGSGPCMGDSGSGLMLNRSGVWMLRGVVSAGQVDQGHCKLDEYVVYCDLAKHATWVRSNII